MYYVHVVLFMAVLNHNFQCKSASPIFFFNPFSSGTQSAEDSENVSIYTTTPKNSSSQTVTESPSVYQQIASNVLERIASHFIVSQQSGKLVSSSSSKPVYADLELFEDPPEEYPEKNNNDAESDKEEEVEDKELINPKLIDINPSFKVIPMRQIKPERLTLSMNISTTTEEPEDSDEEDEDEKDSESKSTEKPRDFTENGLFRIVETIASVITLVSGAISAFFKPMTY